MRIDGTPQVLSGVEKIQTPLVGGSSMTWLPEDETVATTLYVTENGEYDASDSGYYGYSKVTVMVAGGTGAMVEVENEDGTVTEKYMEPPSATAPDSSMVVVDPETKICMYHRIKSDGTIESKAVPSYVWVTKTPKTEYSGTENVDYTGTELTLYYGNGEVATQYNNGVINYGSGAWNSYVVAESGSINDVCRNGIIVIGVKPWWYNDGTSFGKEYYLKAYYKVTIGGAASE